MKSRTCFLNVFAALLVTSTAVAQEPPLYVGGKIGLMDADFSGFDEALNAGVVVGYDVHSMRNTGIFSVEGEFTTTISDGDISGGGEWDADVIAAYGAFRSGGDFYGKAKAGFADQDVKRGGAGGGPIAGDDSGFSWGLGGGWRTRTGARIEAEYTSVSDDLNFLSIAYLVHF